MELNRSINCRDIKKADVVGMDGEKIGNIGDFTFTFDGDLKLSQFILTGSVFEEFLEAIKARPDKDPVFNSSMIKKLDDKVHLDTSRNGLKTTLDKGAISEDEIRLSTIEKLSIYDKNGISIGKAIDVDFDVDGSASLIVGGGFFEEKLEALGLKKDIDIIVPGNVIEEISDRIQLKVEKQDLSLTMEEVVAETNVPSVRDSVATHREISKIRLYSHRPI
ncbi:MAG: PRC-barrel domain-containing protein [Candidatus Thorarchaeota archaeon]